MEKQWSDLREYSDSSEKCEAKHTGIINAVNKLRDVDQEAISLLFKITGAKNGDEKTQGNDLISLSGMLNQSGKDIEELCESIRNTLRTIDSELF